MYNLNYGCDHFYFKNLNNYAVVIFFYESLSIYTTSLYKRIPTVRWIIEQHIIVNSHLRPIWYTIKLDKKKPIMFPTLDFDDHIPTNEPSDFTLKWWLNIVINEGKNENWKNPNTVHVMNSMKYVDEWAWFSNYWPFIIATIGKTA